MSNHDIDINGLFDGKYHARSTLIRSITRVKDIVL